MNLAEQWTPNGSNSQRGGLYRVKRRLHERSSPGAAVRGEGNGRKTELVFAQPDGKREGALARDTLKRQANNFIRRVTVARRNIAAIATRDTIYAAVFSLLARRL